jgi:hypothetical protein
MQAAPFFCLQTPGFFKELDQGRSAHPTPHGVFKNNHDNTL